MSTEQERLDFFAANAPMPPPASFERKCKWERGEDEMGIVDNKYWTETIDEWKVRWRWHYADTMVAYDKRRRQDETTIGLERETWPH